MCATMQGTALNNFSDRPRGEMDIILVFGTSVGGSNPSEGTKSTNIFIELAQCVYATIQCYET